jgi:hypothetical protein
MIPVRTAGFNGAANEDPEQVDAAEREVDCRAETRVQTRSLGNADIVIASDYVDGVS